MQAFDIPADLDTPVSAFLKIEPFHPRFLLESVEGGERLGRFSFIGFGNGVQLTVEGDSAFIDGERLDDSIAPLDAARLALERAPLLAPELEHLPYSGGLVGVSGFELAHHFNPVSAPRTDAETASYFAPESLLVFDHVTHRIALLHAGPPDERASLRTEIVRALRGPVSLNGNGIRVSLPTPTIARAQFLEAVDRAKDHIRAGDVYQLVLSIGFTGECDIDPFQVYRALRILNPSPYMYYLRTPRGSIAGSSPEVLVKLQGRNASLRPIAGTRRRGQSTDEDLRLERELLADPKEAAEHVMLVDLARNDVGRLSVPGSVKVDPFRSIERYSHVMHLVSGVTGLLKPEYDSFDLFASAFPAGTVVGAPKLRALELIGTMEPTLRGFYAGTVGYFGRDNKMDQAIAIRTVQFQDGRYRYQAGAGIVYDSVSAREYDEVLEKTAVLKAAMRLAEEEL